MSDTSITIGGTTYTRTPCTLYPSALIICEYPHRGSPMIWTAKNLVDATVKCIEAAHSIRKSGEEFDGIKTVDDLKKALGKDLRRCEIYTAQDFEQTTLDSFDPEIIEAASSLDWVTVTYAE